MGLTGSSFVATNKGLLTALEVYENFSGVRFYTSQGWQPVVNVFKNDPRPTLSITTEYGNTIHADFDQKFFLKGSRGAGKFVNPNQLKVEDTIVLLPSENGVGNYYTSLKVEKTPEITFNGPFAPGTAFFLGYYVAQGQQDEKKKEIFFWVSKSILGIFFDFNEALAREGFHKGSVANIQEGTTQLFKFTVRDPLFWAWMQKNHLMVQQLPKFLLYSPADVISAFFVGFILGKNMKRSDYVLKFQTAQEASLAQLLLFQEGILSLQDQTIVEITTERARAEFDKLFAKCHFCPREFSVQPRTDAFQNFCDVDISELQKQEKETTYTFQLEQPGGFTSNGFYTSY